MLNQIKHKHEKAILAFIFFALLIGSGCGKRKPPLPPIENIAQRVEISGFQRGNNIFLAWTMPNRNASDGSVVNISRADIYRLTEPLNSTNNITEEDFASRSTIIATVPITDSDFGRKQFNYNDKLNFAGQPARISYAIRFVNSQGQKAAFSNFLVIEPTAKIANSPTDLQISVSQNAIEIKWIRPTANVDGSTPANILGFNIYRFETEQKNPKVLNSSPVNSDKYDDKIFEFGKEYSYFIRTVSLGADGSPLESANSENIKVIPKDIFPPSAPTALTIAATPNSISIFFATNLESDIAGYKIYRSTDPNLPKNEWELLTPQLLQTNTFQDANVEAGKTYYYYLTAVDKFGNTSDISVVVSETTP